MIDGPFAETKELVAGFWLIQVKSKEEAIEWVKRCPNPMNEESEIEIRQVFEAEDFGDELTPELREQEERLRAQIGGEPVGSDAVGRRHAPHDRRGLEDRVGAGSSPASRGSCATSAWPRSSRRTRSSPRSSSGRSRASRTTRAPGSWPPRSIVRSTCLRRSKRLERKHEELGSRARGPAGSGRAGSRRRARRRRRRRPPAPRVHGLPSGALHRGARRAHAPPARRPDDRGDRARVPRPGADRRPAHRPGQADPRRGARPLRGARAGTSSPARLSSVLEVIYLIFNEGYSATAGDDWMRPALCEDALRLGRILAELAPEEPEVHGLVALMEIQASRSRARIGPSGEPVLLLDQNRARWDQLLIRRGLAALERAEELGGALGPVRAPGRDRRLSRASAHAGGDGLGAHRGALRRARPARAVARRRAEPRGRGRDGVRSGSGPRARRRADLRAARSRATTCCRACAATSSPSSAASTRPARSSSARRRSRATRASASCCSSARPSAHAAPG